MTAAPAAPDTADDARARPAIVFEAVTKALGGRTILDRLDLEVPPGRFVVLIGPSGCGKTTTLKLVNRLESPDGGRVLVDGEDIARRDAVELRRGIGYVIQSGGLFPHWTVRDNIATVPRLLGWPRSRIRARIEELVGLLRLPADHIGRYPHQLSGGQQQRVGIARALAADPPILLMDEPFSALDPVTRLELQDEIKEIQQRTGKTVVFVTHDVDEAIKLATDIALLNAGRLACFGSPRQVTAAQAGSFTYDFLGGGAIGLRRLALEQVADRARSPGPGAPGRGGPQVAADASLREALSAMLEHGADRLSVVDAAGRPVGTLGWSDLAPR
ncbi:ABC transporter ATP-binding protein [Chelatococcus reniformis]|uniref:ABC transporter ATP-binding protein n=1 Tax=Chelatococcus reniformis TaxID=1494448 RepID=A0A916TZ88_9HYPH|nr:ABC transporter ATP-binding protein [Chelatococcus reniformis]GGC52248.1 ABC transporter ATP-binding protein [Chelatococcus reniformis]